MSLVPRKVAFDASGRCVAAGVACDVTPHAVTHVIPLPTDNPDFLGPVNPVGLTLGEIGRSVLVEELRQFADEQDDYIASLCNRAAEGLSSLGCRVDLIDPMRPEGPKVHCRVSLRPDGIFIYPKGYGDSDHVDGEGCPIVIELFEGTMRVVVWDNINDDRPSHIIPIEGAREDAREEDEDTDQTSG